MPAHVHRPCCGTRARYRTPPPRYRANEPQCPQTCYFRNHSNPSTHHQPKPARSTRARTRTTPRQCCGTRTRLCAPLPRYRARRAQAPQEEPRRTLGTPRDLGNPHKPSLTRPTRQRASLVHTDTRAHAQHTCAHTARQPTMTQTTAQMGTGTEPRPHGSRRLPYYPLEISRRTQNPTIHTPRRLPPPGG